MSNPGDPEPTPVLADAVERPWVLYLVECAGDRLYAGITNDLAARFQAHVDGRGARFTRAFAPVRIVAAATLPSRSAALKAEYALKRQPRSRKIGFLRTCGTPVDPRATWVIATQASSAVSVESPPINSEG